MPLTSPPAQNAVPAPVISSAPTSGLSPQVLIMVRSAGVSWSDSALRTSGRLSVRMATRSRITQSNSVVPVSMVVSVVVMSNSPQFPLASTLRAAKRQSNPAFLAWHGLLRCARNDGNVWSVTRSKLLHPWPQFQLPAPGAVRLLQQAEGAEGNGVGVEQQIRPFFKFGARGAANAAIDDEMRDMNSLRRQFARHALGEPAQREFSHREGCGLRIALDAGGSAGEQDRAVLVGQHPFYGLLRDQKAAERADRDRLRHVGRHQIGEHATRPAAGVVDDHVGRPDLTLDQAEQALDLVRVGGIAGKGAGAGLAAERTQLFDPAGRQRDPKAFAGKQPRQRGAEALAGADNEGGLVVRLFHERLPFLSASCFQLRNPARQPAASSTASSADLSATSAYLARNLASDRA